MHRWFCACSFFADDKKADIRSKVWNYLDKNKLSELFSPFKKISNFKVVITLITYLLNSLQPTN